MANESNKNIGTHATLREAGERERLRDGINAMRIGDGRYKVTQTIFDGGMAVVYRTEKVEGTGPNNLIIKQMAFTTQEALFASPETANAYLNNWKREHGVLFKFQETPQRLNEFVEDMLSGIRNERVSESMRNIVNGASGFDELKAKLNEFVNSPLGQELREKAKTQTAEFLREYAILQYLNHQGVKNIPQIYDIVVKSKNTLSVKGKEMYNFYFAQEEAEGESLVSYIARGGALMRQDVMRISLDLAHTLNQIHELGIIHRDISYNNVFIVMDQLGHMQLSKLIDLGIAVAKHDPSYSALVDMPDLQERGLKPDAFRSMGTKEFIAPEVTRVVSRTADVYAFGKLLFFMLTGEVPEKDTIAFSQQLGRANGYAAIDKDLLQLIRDCTKDSYKERIYIDEVVQRLEGMYSPIILRRIKSGTNS